MTVHGAKGLQAPIVIPARHLHAAAAARARGSIPCRARASRRTRSAIWSGPRQGTRSLAGIEDSKELVERAERAGISPAALRRHDAGGGPALCLRLGGPAETREGKVWYDLVRDGLAGHLTAHADADGKTAAAHGERADGARNGLRGPRRSSRGRTAARLGGRDRAARAVAPEACAVAARVWARGRRRRAAARAAAARAAGAGPRMAATPAGGSSTPCCSICRRLRRRTRNGRRGPSSPREAPISRKS